MALRSLMFALFLAITLSVAYTERTACCGDGIPTSARYTLQKFFHLLKVRGQELSFFTSDDKTEKTLELERFGERMDENLVLFTPETALGSLRKSDLLHFLESGGHVLLSASKRITKVQRNFALECGVEFDNKKAPLGWTTSILLLTTVTYLIRYSPRKIWSLQIV
ncbi:hypothetical protein PsorP6_016310 [Peronosclerospora sorghi]|uniref:Uncharacterized protein n=1 Tax=Peronosclerospora sorghi TaxID=230839 RepID=A0ACC0VQE5_9STRA|nr:hypothetical protein PsorP6_016310 [Peronosclerospora sorghi]